MSAAEIHFERIGKAGVITLDRPKALNALTHGMIRAMAPALQGFADDPAIAHVVIRQTGERAFCAGGDIRVLVEDIKARRFDAVEAFYRDEYRLNRQIKRFPKPYIALLDGIVMGGGVGVSVHGSRRVGTERLAFAMPEVGIGLFPDVGGTYFLPRLPGRIGLYLALTGERIGAADALWAGILTHITASADMPALFEALTEADDVDAVLRRFAKAAPPAPLAARQVKIDRLFSAPTLSGVWGDIAEASRGGDAEARALLETLAKRSPTSLAIAFEQMRRGGELTFEDALRLEWRIVNEVARGHDFPEGVRAVILDKDNRPAWNPPSLDALDAAAFARHFAPPAAGDLDFP